MKHIPKILCLIMAGVVLCIDFGRLVTGTTDLQRHWPFVAPIALIAFAVMMHLLDASARTSRPAQIRALCERAPSGSRDC